jgi:hypothetical protein
VKIPSYEVLTLPTASDPPTSSSSTTSINSTISALGLVPDTSTIQQVLTNPGSISNAGNVIMGNILPTPSGAIYVFGNTFFSFAPPPSPGLVSPVMSDSEILSVGPYGNVSVYGGGLYPDSEMQMHGTVSKQSLGRLRADKSGNFIGSVTIPEGTQTGPLKLVAFGFNAKKKPIVLPFTINVEVLKDVATTSTSVVVDTSIASTDSTIVTTADSTSGGGTAPSLIWIVILVALVLAVAIFFLLRRNRSKLNDQTL